MPALVHHQRENQAEPDRDGKGNEIVQAGNRKQVWQFVHGRKRWWRDETFSKSQQKKQCHQHHHNADHQRSNRSIDSEKTLKLPEMIKKADFSGPKGKNGTIEGHRIRPGVVLPDIASYQNIKCHKKEQYQQNIH